MTFSWPHRGSGFDVRSEQQRLAEVVLRCAAALVAADAEPRALIERKCELLTSMLPHIVLAWTWCGPADTDEVVPQAVAGTASAYARALVIRRTALTSIGPAYRTLAGKRLEPFNVSALSLYEPWREVARDHGVRSVLALPLTPTADAERGLFVLYSDVPDYFDLVGVGLFDALAQLFSAVLTRAQRQTVLARAAYQDALTGLRNRGSLAVLQPSLRRTAPIDAPVAVMMLDVDHFKAVNDVHGHATGDQALRHIARLLQSRLRAADTLVRWGGEEFVAVVAGVAPQDAVGVAEQLRAAVAAEPLALDTGGELALTVSIGLSMLRVDEALVSAIGRADAALYRAKHAGRNRVCSDEAAAS